MNESKENQAKKKQKRDKFIFISIFCFAVAMIFVGIITAIMLGVVNKDLDNVNSKNDKITQELEELENL